MPKTVAMTFRVSPELKAALEALAARQHRSVNNLLETLAIAATKPDGNTLAGGNAHSPRTT